MIEDESPRRFMIERVGHHEVATCVMCGRDFVVSELTDADECCRALEALKEWATHDG